MSEPEARLLMQEMSKVLHRVQTARWDPYPWQRLPDHIATMGSWLLLGGRGTGKTEAGSRYVDRHMCGPPCDDRIPGGHRVAIIAPTIGDAHESCVSGPSGILAVNRGARVKGGTGGSHVIWPDKQRARLFGAYTREDVERLRSGGNNCLVWMEEGAAMRYLGEVLTQARLGLRIGANPHFVWSTTPKPRKELKEVMADERTILSRGSTRDAVKLDPEWRAELIRLYEGTRLGRQELDAEILDDVEGALWSWAIIDAGRVPVAPTMDRICVAVDPPGSEDGAEAGIVVVGRKGDHAYVLSDLSGRMSPEEWGTAAIQAYVRWNANAIVPEKNYGGDMVTSTIRLLPGGANCVVIPVVAKQGKEARADPVVALYQQTKVHHVGVLSGLETQLTEWVPGNPSPDRLDALVHGVTHLLVKAGPATIGNPARMGRVLPGPR